MFFSIVGKKDGQDKYAICKYIFSSGINHSLQCKGDDHSWLMLLQQRKQKQVRKLINAMNLD